MHSVPMWERSGSQSATGETTMPPEPTCFCLSCNMEIPEADDVVPAAGDDAAWTELAEIHAEDCEWVLTRAYRRN